MVKFYQCLSLIYNFSGGCGDSITILITISIFYKQMLSNFAFLICEQSESVSIYKISNSLKVIIFIYMYFSQTR